MKDERAFETPGPGSWELESTHFQRPLTAMCAELFPENFAKGFAAGTADYGLMLSHFEVAIVHGFVYLRAVPYGAPPTVVKPPPRPVFFLLTRLLPSVRRRLRASRDAVARKRWRDDLRRWDEEIKPAALRKHEALQQPDPRRLDDAALARHLEAAHDHLGRMTWQHHALTITSCVPTGDFLAHVQEWTGKPAGEILRALKGSTPVSNGIAADELEELGAAVREDQDAGALLASSAPAGEVLAQLRGAKGRTGAAATAYLEVVGHRSLGYDIADPYALELPDVLVRAVRAAVDAHPRATTDASSEQIQALRDAVPDAHRATFDDLLAEARHMNRLRDERGQYCDAWACGLVRRAVLEVGRRLAERGTLGSRELAIEATRSELLALLRGDEAPSSDELAARAEWRTTKTIADAPPWLGAEPSPPPPAEWLPAQCRRATRAIDAVLGNLWGQPAPVTTARSVKGLAVSPGVYEGVARVVSDETDFRRIQQGDILVARATSPYFNVVLPLLGGIVTDRGGQLSHAAIVAREYGIPAVVGTTDATRIIRDGTRIVVDGTRGEIQVLE